MHIRAATPEDLPALQELRNYYIANSFSTFDEQPLNTGDIEKWFSQFHDVGLHRLLVASQNRQLLGFCSSQAYRAHPAFSKTIETSVYVAPQASRHGIGSALYEALLSTLSQEPIHRVVVGIALPNPASIALHEKFGFTKVGVFSEYACKNGKFISSQWMEKPFQLHC